MELKKQNILFFPRTMGLGGTENVVLQLCDILNPMVNKIIVCSCGGIHVKTLETMGIKHYLIPDITDRKISTVLKTIYTLKKIIKKENITIIHSHHRMAALYSNLISNKEIIKIANAHNVFFDKKIMTKISYNNTNIIAVGENVKKNLVNDFKIDENNIQVIYNSVKDFTEEIKEIKIIQEEKYKGNYLIGNIGRLTKQKGMEYFIDAAELVIKKISNTKFFIIGEGEDREILEKKVKKKGLEKFIFFLGYRSDIQNVISQLDFIVLSSLWEGLPLTPIEAYSVGKTVVGTCVDGTPEIIHNDIDGYLVEPKNIISLANKMAYLIENPEKKKDLEKAAKKTFKKNFSFQKMKEEYIKYYKGL